MENETQMKHTKTNRHLLSRSGNHRLISAFDDETRGDLPESIWTASKLGNSPGVIMVFKAHHSSLSNDSKEPRLPLKENRICERLIARNIFVILTTLGVHVGSYITK